jgi:hypothetical protein
MGHKVINIGLDLVENYSSEVTDRVDYLSCFSPEQVLVKEDIDSTRA